MPLAALTVLVASGLALESYALPEARIVAELPGQPELVSAGPSGDVPQSVQGFAWRSEGSGINVTVSYDKWKTAHFSSDIALDRVARQAYGRLEGFTIQPSEVGGLTGSRLTLDAPQGATVAVWNVKSGTEAWQITVKPTDGYLTDSMLEDVRNGLRIDAKPEPAGLYTEWGAPTVPDISSRPVPSPLKWSRTSLEGLSFEAPLAMTRLPESRSPGETASLDGLQEWYGSAAEVEVFVSTYTIKENLGVDLAAWGDTFNQMMDRDGIRSWQPKSEAFPIGDAQTLLLTSPTQRDGQTWKVEIILAVKGRQAWAIQTRVRDTEDGRDALSRVTSSLVLK